MIGVDSGTEGVKTAVRPEDVRFDAGGLIPAVVQDARTGLVLTVAYMNAEALELTVKTGETWFYSRSRKALWHKGETSGNTQRVREIAADCDADALLVLVEPQGPACHTGDASCFSAGLRKGTETEGFEAEAATRTAHSSGSGSEGILERLEHRVREREALRPQGSYTTYLFEKGLDKILKKVGEETAEVIIAAKNRSGPELRCEVADLLYHLAVLLREQDLPWSEVLGELESRYAAEENR